MLVVVAAGNEGLNSDVYPSYPANFRGANLVAVAATDGHGNLAANSNWGGHSVDLGAPGVDVATFRLDRYVGTYFGYFARRCSGLGYGRQASVRAPERDGFPIASCLDRHRLPDTWPPRQDDQRRRTRCGPDARLCLVVCWIGTLRERTSLNTVVHVVRDPGIRAPQKTHAPLTITVYSGWLWLAGKSHRAARFSEYAGSSIALKGVIRESVTDCAQNELTSMYSK